MSQFLHLMSPIGPIRTPRGGLVFTSEGGERRRLCVMHQYSFPTQREFAHLTEPDFVRLLERAMPE